MHADDAQSPRGGEYTSHLVEEDGMIDPDLLSLTKELGRGAFGVVYKGTYLGTVVAVKKLFRTAYTTVDEVKAQFEHEVKVLRALRHPNIVLFMGIAQQDDELYLVQEYIDGGSLRDLLTLSRLDAKEPREFPWNHRMKIAIEIARGLAWLHNKGIWHRDLKCENILLTKNLDVKLADFGLARIFKRAPEIKSGSGSYVGSSSGGGGSSSAGAMSPVSPATPTKADSDNATDFEIITEAEDDPQRALRSPMRGRAASTIEVAPATPPPPPPPATPSRKMLVPPINMQGVGSPDIGRNRSSTSGDVRFVLSDAAHFRDPQPPRVADVSTPKPSSGDLKSAIRRLRIRGSQVGSPWWRAPEVEASSYNYKIDIFSLGVVYLEIITGAEGEDIRLAMSYQKPGSLKFGVDPHRLRDVFKTQSATCPRAFWETAISCCEESPAKRPETDQIISRLQTLYAAWTEAEGTIHRFIPQKDGAKLWLSLIISQFEGTAITSVTMEALLSELKQQIAAISHRDLDQSEVDFLTDLIVSYDDALGPVNSDTNFLAPLASARPHRVSQPPGVATAVLNTLQNVSVQTFSRFWEWFHPLLKLISNTRVLALFKARFIKGFVSKQAAWDALKESTPGTCIVRFSQTNPGNLVVTMVNDAKDIKDIVVQVTREALYIKEQSFATFKDALEQHEKLRRLRFVYPNRPLDSDELQVAHSDVDSRPSTPRWSFRSSTGV